MIAFAKPDNLIDFPQPQGESILLSCKSEEWYTPHRYIEAARKVMNGIELDPESCAEANWFVKANRYFTKEDNGLAQAWNAHSIWLNPPYGRTAQRTSRTELWVKRLIQEYRAGNVTQAVLLIPTRIETHWFQLVWEYPICFTDHRIMFLSPGKPLDSNIIGSAFVYLGPHELLFIDTFSKFGTIAKRVSEPRQTVTPLSLWEVSP